MGTREAQKNYRDNWERTFNKKSKPKPSKKVEAKANEAVADR
jgi:hypothetical protein